MAYRAPFCCASAASAKPRKTLVQCRSRVTVDAIFEAIIQVLLRDMSGRDAQALNLTLAPAIDGTVRDAFERGLSKKVVRMLHQTLTKMCQAYLGDIASPARVSVGPAAGQ